MLLPHRALALGVGGPPDYSQEFLILFAWVGVAVFAMLLWPTTVLIRFFRQRKQALQQKAQSKAAMASVPISESKVDVSQDHS